MLYGHDAEEQITADCGFPAEGCWRSPVARSILEFVPHELVHAWTATAQARPLPALQEGIAVRMGGLVPRMGTNLFTVEDLLLDEVPPERYPSAGHFVAWLMATYGSDAFMELYAGSSRGMTRDEVSRLFEQVLGDSVDAVLSAYAASAKDYYPAMGAAACGRVPVTPWQGDVVTFPIEGSCEEGPYFGFEDSNWWQRASVEVTVSGTYLLDAGGRPAAVTRCLTAPADEAELPPPQVLVTGDWRHGSTAGDLDHAFGFDRGEDWADEPIELEVGTYEIWVERRSREIPSLDIERRGRGVRRRGGRRRRAVRRRQR